MFELLDDGREGRRRAILRPRYAIFAALSLLLIGVEVGILIGKRDWVFWDWFTAVSNALVLLMVFAPLCREFYKFLGDREVD